MATVATVAGTIDAAGCAAEARWAADEELAASACGTGADGAPGADGADGIDGTPGADGADGTPGADGYLQRARLQLQKLE